MFYYSQQTPDCLLYRFDPHSTYNNIYESNPRGYFDDRNSVVLSMNSRGFRGDEFTKYDKSDRKIAFIGDSFTLGEGVHLKDIYPEKTVALLNAGNKGGDAPYRCCNFGMLALNTVQEYSFLIEEALPIEPDIVVLGYFLNDAAGPYFEMDPKTNTILENMTNPFWYGLDKRPPDSLLYNSRIAAMLWKAANQRKISENTKRYYKTLYSENSPTWEVNRDHLIKIIHTCKDREITLIVLSLPLLYKTDGNYPFTYIHNIIADIVRTEGGENTSFIDMLPYFKDYQASDLWVYPTDHHPNEKAHAVIADVLQKHISKMGDAFGSNKIEKK